MNSILKYIDKFLPAGIWTSKEAVLRARVAIFLFSFDLLQDLIWISYFIAQQQVDSGILGFVLYAVLDCIFLLLIKRSYSVGKLVAAFVFIGLILFTLEPMFLAGQMTSFIGISPYIPNLMLTLLLFPSLRSRIVFVSWILGLNACAWYFGNAFDSASKSAADATVSFLFFMPTSLALIYAYLKFRDFMQDDLDQEFEWQLRSARLEEVAVMTRAMHSLMSKPIREFRRNMLDVKESREVDDEGVEKIGAEMERLVEISRSFSWIYRAYRDEESCSSSSEVLFRHLQILLSMKIENAGWKLKPKPIEQDVEIYGPIPSLMLLLFRKVTLVLENSGIRDSCEFEMGIAHDRESIVWTFSWPSKGSLISQRAHEGRLTSQSDRAEDLVQELAEACGAKISEYEEWGYRRLLIRGAWRRFAKESLSCDRRAK